MNRKPISKEKQNFIAENYGVLKGKEIAAAIGVTPACVSYYINGKRGILYETKLKKYA